MIEALPARVVQKVGERSLEPIRCSQSIASGSGSLMFTRRTTLSQPPLHAERFGVPSEKSHRLGGARLSGPRLLSCRLYIMRFALSTAQSLDRAAGRLISRQTWTIWIAQRKRTILLTRQGCRIRPVS